MARKRPAGDEDDKGKAPRSKRAARQQAKTADKPLFDWRRVAGYAAVIMLLGVVYWATQVDGGAPQRGIDAAKGSVAMFTDWRLDATDANGTTTVLCGLKDPCIFAELRAAHEADATCHLDGRIWLSSEGMPMVLRSVDIRYNATALSGNYLSNSSQAQLVTSHDAGTLQWDGGWWWRPQKEHVDIRAEVPCVAHTLTVLLPIQAKGLWGGAEGGTQRTSVQIHTEYLDSLRRERESPPPST